MSWTAIRIMVAGAFGFKVFGVLGLSRLADGPGRSFQAITALIPAALFSAMVVVQTIATDDRLVLDARVWGVGAGIVAVWRRAPFILVVVLTMAVTALVRWQTLV